MTKPKLEGTMQYTAIAYTESTDQWNITMTGSDWPWIVKVPPIKCPDCGTTHIRKNGYNEKHNKKYNCLNDNCKRHTFTL